MLQKIEKKDGSIENYSRQKIENWILWGGENIKGTVNFDEVIDKAVSKFSVQAKSSELQKELISQLLQLGTTSGNLLAGRLYMADIANDVHDRVYPPLKHQVKRVHKLNLGRKFAYSDDELDEIDKAIDHQRNYAMSYDQIRQVYTKYSLNNRVMKKIYETPQFVYARIALHVCEKDPIEKRIANVIETYDYLSLNKVNSPSPNYINIGTNHLGLASCCLYRTDDNLDSMEAGNHIAYKMTAMSAGIGGYMALRSIGDPIRGGSIVHAGKIPYMRDIGGRVTANLQAGRGGACNQFYIIFDPEAQVLAQAQNPRTPVSKQNRSIHFTAMINDFFLRKVNNKEKIFTFTEFSAPDLHKAFFYGESETFTKIYEEYEKDEGFKKNYVDAAELASMIKQQSAEVATHYICNMTEINRHTPHKDTIFLSNLCVAPETPILTKEYGYREIYSLENQEISVWNGKQWSKTTVKKTGVNQELITVVTNSGSIVEATPYHKWYIQTQDNNGDKSVVVEKRTFELQPGDKLIKYELSPCDHGELDFPFAYENGFITGDGTDLGYNRRRAYLYGDKKQLLNNFNLSSDICVYRENGNRIEIDYRKNVIGEKYNIPSNQFTLASRIKWLEGLVDSEGCLTNNSGTCSIQLTSNNYDFLFRLRLTLQELGIRSKITEGYNAGFRDLPDHRGGEKSYYCKKTWRILISNFDTIKLKELGFNPSRINLDNVRPGNGECNHFEKIELVTNTGRKDDTYCFTESLENKGMFGGVLAGNCVEITQPTFSYHHIMDLYKEEDHGRGEVSLCSLGAIVEPNIVDDADYERAAYISLKIIDFCIDNTEYALPHIGFTAKKRRNAGVGLIGIAHTLAKNSIRYSSNEGLAMHHAIAERHSYFLIKASLQLAKEHGCAEWIHKTKWPEGWLPIDTYKRSVDEVTPNTLQYEWEPLRAEIIKVGGIRHSSLVAHMPTESSSKATGYPNCFYPIRALVLKKSDMNNVIDWVAKDNDIFGDQYELA